MKKIIALVVSLFVGYGCTDTDASDRINSTVQGETTDASVPIFQFEKETHDFGTLTEGEVGMTVFRFTNTGSVPLIISAAQGSCGCTVPTWPEAPIAPGAEGEIEVRFNSENRVGSIDKTVTLTANTVPNTKVLRITGQVVKP